MELDLIEVILVIMIDQDVELLKLMVVDVFLCNRLFVLK